MNKIGACRLGAGVIVGLSMLLCCAAAWGKGKPDGGARMEMTIEETTQARIAGWKVAVGNIWEREYPDANGRMLKGPAAAVSIVEPGAAEARKQDVGKGSVLDLGSAGIWDVKDVCSGPKGGNGHIRIAKRP